MPVGFYDGDQIEISGGTDQTRIGNVGDSLKTAVTQSALPTGASTAALQTTGNTSLSSIDGKLNSLGQKLSAASVPVVIASDQLVSTVVNFGTKSAYSAVGLFTAANLATDVITLSGSATKTVKVLGVYFKMTATTGANGTCLLVKRSTANSGGTSTTLTVVPFDSNDAAGTAVVRAYTVNPTLGTSVGNIYTDEFYVSGGGTVSSTPFQYDSFYFVNKPITLRGVNESVAVNLNGVTYSGNVARANFIWTEE